MKIEQKKKTSEDIWVNVIDKKLNNKAQLVFAFGEVSLLKDINNFKQIREFYPKAEIISCSTAGEIIGTEVRNDNIVATAISFDKTRIKSVAENIKDMSESKSLGERLAKKINQKDLKHAMVFADGLGVNGSEIAKGINSVFPDNVAVTGGMAGDQDKFKETIVGLNESIGKNMVVLIGFYGDDLQVGYGSVGGWDPFGLERLVTKSKGNVLYELDNQPVLELYKKYLGKMAEGLPSTGLLFPLSVRTKDKKTNLVRTVLSIDEKGKSMTFAGDIMEGSYAQLMKANFDRLIEGASNAAKKSKEINSFDLPELAILISCVGRKLVLKQRIEEEVESVQKVLGKQAVMTGFYSYGEISPAVETSKKCELHNQTMTITIFKEG